MTHDEMIAVVKAHKEGKQIQTKKIDANEWEDDNKPIWNFNYRDYRVKPQPKTVPWEFEDYLEHWDCWYKASGSGLASRITDFNAYAKGIFASTTKIYLSDQNLYSPTPNGEFLPCVKEVEE